jgi:hypothetical protein
MSLDSPACADVFLPKSRYLSKLNAAGKWGLAAEFHGPAEGTRRGENSEETSRFFSTKLTDNAKIKPGF